MPEAGTYLSARNVPVFCALAPLMPGGTVNEISLVYGKGGKGKICWWPDTPVCQPQIEQVFQWFTNDFDSIGKPIKVMGAEEAAAFVALRSPGQPAGINAEAPDCA